MRLPTLNYCCFYREREKSLSQLKTIRFDYSTYDLQTVMVKAEHGFN